MKRFAVIDLGTNTFHLLIAARQNSHEFIVIYRERAFVKLAEEGINTIGRHAFKRGLDTLKKFREIMDLFEIIDYRAIATAAMRNADNADIFIKRAKRSAGINIEVISGSMEADLIYKGIRTTPILSDKTSLIMDIGGGSVEFILGTKREKYWAASLDIGAAVLKRKFHFQEPIAPMERLELKKFLEKETRVLQQEIKNHQPVELVGASGTFDVLADNLSVSSDKVAYPIVSVKDFRSFCKEIVALSVEERIEHPGIPETRADLIVVALLLIEYVVGMFEASAIKISDAALKEGVIYEMIQNYNTHLK